MSPRNIKCPKCGTKMDMHYGLWCPKCDKPQGKTAIIFEYFKVARYIAFNEGYDNEWYHRVLDCINFPGNDCIVWHYVSDDEDSEEADEYEELKQFDAGLVKHFGIKPGDTVYLEISW